VDDALFRIPKQTLSFPLGFPGASWSRWPFLFGGGSGRKCQDGCPFPEQLRLWRFRFFRCPRLEKAFKDSLYGLSWAFINEGM